MRSSAGLKVEGMDHEDGDVLAADAPRRGGLRKPGGDGPKFVARPASQTSQYGLDRLAAQKRAEAAGIKSEPPSKRVKVEVDEDENGVSKAGGVFKGEFAGAEREADCAVPAIPVKREAVRVKPDETPSHGGGLSDSARQKLEAYRRQRNMPSSSTTADSHDKREREHRGIDDYQSRLNKGSWQDRERRRDDRGYRRDDRDYGRRDDRRDDRQDRSNGDRRNNWSDAPRSERSQRDLDGGSVRVPNRGWDETPSRGPGGWGKGGDSSRPGRSWDETPSRRSRGASPSNDDGEILVDGKEWEEEQVRLDRDWYNIDDEGMVAGDEEHNPFQQWSSLEASKEQELQAKVQKRQTARQAQFVGSSTSAFPS